MHLGIGLRTTRFVRRLRPLRCSFCGRTEAEVEKLAAGAGAFICDGCAVACSKIFDEVRPAAPNARPS